MSKFWPIAFIVLIAGLMYTGVLEVKINTKASPHLSSLTSSFTKEKSTFETGRAYFVGLKRKGEFLVFHDKEKRLVLSHLYVKTDSKRLEELISAHTSPEALVPQAELLVSSLNLVRETAQKAPVEVVASMKDDSSEAFSNAQLALGQLQGSEPEYQDIQMEFTRLTKALESQIGELDIEHGAVAGTSDVNESLDLNPSPHE